MQQTQTNNKISGFHHLAICTGDIKGQIDFFTDKLGMELQSMYWMHGVPDTWHAFLRLNDESSLTFVSNPQIKQIPMESDLCAFGNFISSAIFLTLSLVRHPMGNMVCASCF